ncbi:hypothetical protein [Neisseria bacilliformis]|uniref:hypothetical protein n=1 Tax=Neisseria bacilliformis TaxID=267212 RepID=UPI000B2032ED|nr:hypothetical protein [Neisseria bacilliformis]
MPDKSRQQKTSGMNARPAALTAVIPAQAGILAEFGQQFVFFFFTYCRAPNKIPACAGMTA